MSRFSLLFVASVLAFSMGCKKKAPESMPEVAVPSAPPVSRPPPEAPPAASASAAQLNRAYFGFDSASLGEDAKRALTENARLLSAHPDVRVEVQGHCDERGTTEYNMALGQRRAQAARAYLASQGVSANRVATVSYGEERPARNGGDEGAWSQNRRVEVRLLSESSAIEGSVR